jgi:hypothetical protein
MREDVHPLLDSTEVIGLERRWRGKRTRVSVIFPTKEIWTTPRRQTKSSRCWRFVAIPPTPLVIPSNSRPVLVSSRETSCVRLSSSLPKLVN